MVDSLDCAKPACYTSTGVSVGLTGKDVNCSVSVPLVCSIMNLYEIGHVGVQLTPLPVHVRMHVCGCVCVCACVRVCVCVRVHVHVCVCVFDYLFALYCDFCCPCCTQHVACTNSLNYVHCIPSALCFTFLTSEDDYISYNYTGVFQPGDTSAELRIPIMDDSLGVEGTEDFFAALSIPASSMYLGVSAGSVDSATVSILDDDNVTVQFSMSEYEVSEDAGEVTLYISSGIPGQSTTPCWCISAMEQPKASAFPL